MISDPLVGLRAQIVQLDQVIERLQSAPNEERTYASALELRTLLLQRKRLSALLLAPEEDYKKA